MRGFNFRSSTAAQPVIRLVDQVRVGPSDDLRSVAELIGHLLDADPRGEQARIREETRTFRAREVTEMIGVIVAHGALEAGGALPSIADMADKVFKVNAGTISRALRPLVADQVIEPRTLKVLNMPYVPDGEVPDHLANLFLLFASVTRESPQMRTGSVNACRARC